MSGPLQNVRVVVLVLLLSVGVNGVLVWSLHRHPGEPITLTLPTPAPTRTPAPTATPAPIVVHVSGAVARPGVYELPAGSRASAAIEAAGGFTNDADAASINLAAALQDEVQVHVPAEGETEPPTAGVHAEAPQPEEPVGEQSGSTGGQINVNTAGATTLTELPGIGPALAERIITYREEVGPFSSVDDLTNVKGIGTKTMEEIRPLVTVGQ